MDTVIEKYNFTSHLELPEGVQFRSVREKPFDLYGLYEPHAEGIFRRMPEDVAEATSPGVKGLATNTAGGRVRFCTDSTYIVLHAEMGYFGRMNHFPFVGSAGFDMYVKAGARYYFYASCGPAVDQKDPALEKIFTFPTKEMRQIMIHFPLYSNVKEVYLGFAKDSVVDHGCGYRYDKPVVYYGSSITQGGCASRPGNAYQSIISIDYDCDFINLGFSGNAKGEESMRNYIASLDMGAFVMDYDHNAPTVEHLKETYEPLYRAVREAHPTLPILMVSAPDTQHYIFGDRGRDARREVIYDVFHRAYQGGDKYVRYIDGDSLFLGTHHDLCTVDGCHPNDAGFIRMAERIGHMLGSVL